MKRPHQVFPEYSSGSLTKTRYLIGFALQLVSQFKSEGSRRDEHREASVKHLHEVYETLYRGPQHLDDVEVLNLRHHVDLFLRHYTWLRVEAQGRDVKEWNLVSKFHYMRHMAFDCVSLNPSTGSCLADEDFVGHTFIYIYACMYMYVFAYIYICMFIMHVYICIYVYMYMCMYV